MAPAPSWRCRRTISATSTSPLSFGLPVRAVVMPDDQWLAETRAALGRGARGRSATRPGRGTSTAVPGGAGHLRRGVRRRRRRDQQRGRRRVARRPVDTPRPSGESRSGSNRAGLAERQVQYKLRDWLFSRQRYWGEPFPILHGPDGQIRPGGRRRTCRSSYRRCRTSARPRAMTPTPRPVHRSAGPRSRGVTWRSTASATSAS